MIRSDRWESNANIVSTEQLAQQKLPLGFSINLSDEKVNRLLQVIEGIEKSACRLVGAVQS
jgi:hypothetical protein